MSRYSRPYRHERYKTSNWPEYNGKLKQRGSLTVWLDETIKWEAEPNGKRGRQQRFSDNAIQTCLALKVLFSLPLRQTTGLVESLIGLAKLDWAVPDFSTLSRRQKDLKVQLPKQARKGGVCIILCSGV